MFFTFPNTQILCLFSSVQFSHSDPWTAACQVSLSITNSLSLPKLMSIESVMPPNYLILCHPLLLPPSMFASIRVFSNESILHIRWPNIGFSVSASVLPMNIQYWFHFHAIVQVVLNYAYVVLFEFFSSAKYNKQLYA